MSCNSWPSPNKTSKQSSKLKLQQSSVLSQRTSSWPLQDPDWNCLLDAFKGIGLWKPRGSSSYVIKLEISLILFISLPPQKTGATEFALGKWQDSICNWDLPNSTVELWQAALALRCGINSLCHSAAGYLPELFRTLCSSRPKSTVLIA